MARNAEVSARELKTRLGTYLREVRRGRTLVVTDRGEPIAELRPIGSRISDTDAALAKLKSKGAVTQVEDRPLSPFRQVVARGRSLSDAIADDRADRF